MTPLRLNDEERLDWLRLAQSENVGPITFEKLLAVYGSAAKAIAALPELSQRGGMKRPLVVFDKAKAEEAIARASALGARIIASCETDYPEWLRHIPSVPPLICACGRVELAREAVVGIVGARNASAIGLKFTRGLARELCGAGYVIASGLARGIDTAAHEAASPHQTIAVIANGLDYYYPHENEKLQRAIAEEGLLLSEFLPGTVPKAEYFPRRNRIISGLSRAVVVIEAALRSGSLITARFANEQGRQVFAVPGSPLDPRCEGSNRLIKEGASLLTSAQDIFEQFPKEKPQSLFGSLFETAGAQNFVETVVPDVARQTILGLLSPSPVAIDDLIRESLLPPESVMAILLELELAGRSRRDAGNFVFLLT